MIQADLPYANLIMLTAASSRCDLIVMGAHVYSWWQHQGQHNTAERIVRHAPCPMLSVPEEPDTAKNSKR